MKLRMRLSPWKDIIRSFLLRGTHLASISLSVPSTSRVVRDVCAHRTESNCKRREESGWAVVPVVDQLEWLGPA